MLTKFKSMVLDALAQSEARFELSQEKASRELFGIHETPNAIIRTIR